MARVLPPGIATGSFCGLGQVYSVLNFHSARRDGKELAVEAWRVRRVEGRELSGTGRFTGRVASMSKPSRTPLCWGEGGEAVFF